MYTYICISIHVCKGVCTYAYTHKTPHRQQTDENTQSIETYAVTDTRIHTHARTRPCSRTQTFFDSIFGRMEKNIFHVSTCCFSLLHTCGSCSLPDPRRAVGMPQVGPMHSLPHLQQLMNPPRPVSNTQELVTFSQTSHCDDVSTPRCARSTNGAMAYWPTWR